MAPRTPRRRCSWAKSVMAIQYHDRIWGVPLHHDHRLFAFLILEGAQAGLSWETILKKWQHYHEVFDDFDPAKVARYTARKKAALLRDPGIVRNRLKVESAVKNAKAFLAVQDEFGTFDAYVWEFVAGRPKVNRFRSLTGLPATTPESDALSKDLKRRGFNFVGPTICYAFMQAVGMVNDHEVHCFRHKPLSAKR